MASREQFRAAHPEFDALSDEEADRHLAAGRRLHAVTDAGHILAAAHLAALAADGDRAGTPDGGRGEVIAEALGPQRRNYQPQADTPRGVYLASTGYGRALLALEASTPRTRIAARIGV